MLLECVAIVLFVILNFLLEQLVTYLKTILSEKFTLYGMGL
jgi:hypothetical protein